MKILIVDDKEENTYLLETLIKGNGFNTITAKNGAEGLKLALKEKPQLIISDILMPVMDGFTFCREVKKDKYLCKIPFIFYTATYTSSKDEEFALSLGADRFILKPQDPDIFIKIVEELLEDVKGKRIQPSASEILPEDIILEKYNSALIRKLEDKMTQAEETEKKLRKINSELERVIEKHKQTEAALGESERKYRTLVSQSPDGIFIVDLDGNFLSVNETMCKTLNFSYKELLAMSIWDIVPIQYKQQHQERLRKIIKGEGINEATEYEVIGKDGRRHSIEVMSAPFLKEKLLIGYQGIARDITGRKQAEEKITLLAHSIKSISECVSITDNKDNFVFVNDAFLEKYGYTEKEIIGKNRSVIRPQDSEDVVVFKNILPETIKGGWKGEVINVKKDGTKFPVYLSTSVIKNDNNEPIALIGVATDISEMKKAEKELIQAKEIAEKSDRLKSEFLMQISHEIRTPISVISSFISVLKEEMNSLTKDELSDILKSIESSSLRIIRTIELIINMSEMQIGTYNPTWEKIDLIKDVLLRLQREFLLAAKNRNLELIFTMQVEDAFIYGDRYSINQIFDNLLDNAIKYTQKGKIEILVTGDDDKRIKIVVEDTGIGISDEYMNNLFKPFLQEEQGYSRRFEGNGLGLALVKKYCDLNGIQISVESKKEVGSKFTLTFSRF